MLFIYYFTRDFQKIQMNLIKIKNLYFKRFFIFTIKRFNASFKRILYEMINKFGE